MSDKTTRQEGTSDVKVELRVVITEDSKNNLEVKWVAVKKGTEIVLPLRNTHVVGMLASAATVVAVRAYASIEPLKK